MDVRTTHVKELFCSQLTNVGRYYTKIKLIMNDSKNIDKIEIFRWNIN